MDFRIKDLLKLAVMDHATYIGTDNELSNKITGITVMDSPDVAEWLKGGELLITSLFPVRNYTKTQMKEWVAHLSEKKVSAFIIKIEKVFVEIPTEIVSASELYNIPIIQIPKSVPYIDILYPVMEKLFNNQVVELKYYKDVHDRFTALSLADAGTEKIITTLEELIGNPVAVYDRNFHCIAATSNAISLFYNMEKVETRNKCLNSEFAFYTQSVIFPGLQERKSNQVVVPIEAVNNIKMNLVISEIDHQTVPLDFIAIENAATALSLELVKQFAVSEVEMKFKNDLIDDLIEGKMHSLNSVYDRANVIGWDLEGEYVVALFHLKSPTGAITKENHHYVHQQLQKHYDLLIEAINYYLPKGIIRSRSDAIIVLWKIHAKEENNKEWLEKVKKTASDIRVRFKKHIKEYLLQIGIGYAVHSILDIPKSYKTAHDALDLGKVYNTFDFITSFDELGIYRLLYQFEDIESLRKFIPEPLKKLLDYQQASRNDLIETLRVFLKCNQNAARTAQRLYIHYKTVSYRLDRIKELTGLDFEDDEEMLAIQVGLKIIDILTKENLKES